MEHCPNCGFVRKENHSECPKCGIIYDKYKAALVKEKKKESNTNNTLEESLVGDMQTQSKQWYSKTVSNLIFLVYLLSSFALSIIFYDSRMGMTPILLLPIGMFLHLHYNKKYERKKEEEERRKRVYEMIRKEEKLRSHRILEWGLEGHSKEFNVLFHLFSYLERESIFTKEFHSCKIYDVGFRRALELRSGDPHCGAIDSLEFKRNVVREMKLIKNHLSEIDFQGLNEVGEKSFPAVFLFTHQCKFLTVYGEEVSGFDAMVSIPLMATQNPPPVATSKSPTQ